MAERIFLHIGAMKSGTSFIQNVLGENKTELESRGILFPGRKWRLQVAAVLELIEHGGPDQPPLTMDGPWGRMVRQIRHWDGPAVVSMEFLAARNVAKLEQFRAAFPNTPIEIVHTVRDLPRTVTAMWQEAMQNAWLCSWPEYLEAVRVADMSQRNPGRWFWRHHDAAGIAERWSEVFGLENYTLITVPPSGSAPGLLWERFARVTGLPTDLPTDVRANPSLGPASAMVLLELNKRLVDDPVVSHAAYLKQVKKILAKDNLALRTGEPKLGLRERWVMKRGQEQIARLRRLGPRVVGTLDDLTPKKIDGVRIQDVSYEQQLAAAVDGLADLIRDRVRLNQATAATSEED